MSTTTTAPMYEGWAFDLRPMWSMARHRCGYVDYLASPTGEDLARLAEAHQCPSGADVDPVLGQPMTVEIDLGPVSEIVFGSFAQMVEMLPFGLFDRHPLLRAQAERIAEGLSSHLDTPEPPPVLDVAAAPVATARAALQARRISGTLEPGEPVYVSVAEVCEQAGTLPQYSVFAALGIAWVGDTDVPSFELCANHLLDWVLRGDIYRTLDQAALGLVIYEPFTVDCSTCHAEPHLDKNLDQLQADYDAARADHLDAEAEQIGELLDAAEAAARDAEASA
jgi:hypothetical protein